MVAALEIYKNKGVQGLKYCHGTIDFAKMLNDVYDALNRIDIKEGLKIKNADYKVIII